MKRDHKSCESIEKKKPSRHPTITMLDVPFVVTDIRLEDSARSMANCRQPCVVRESLLQVNLKLDVRFSLGRSLPAPLQSGHRTAN